MKESVNLLLLAFFLSMLTGCPKLLPTTNVTIQSPWKNYEDAKVSYEKIVPGKTTLDDLKSFGYDPALMPNIRIMNATEVITMFLPNPSIKKEESGSWYPKMH